MPKATKSPRRCHRCQGRPILQQCEHTKAGRAHLAQVASNIELAGSFLPQASEPAAPAAVPPPTTPSIPVNEQVGDPVIDPRLQQVPTQIHPATHLPEPGLDKTRAQVVCLRATKQNPIYGFVEGCTRGSDELAIVRTQNARDPEPSVRKASKIFARDIRRLVAQAEQVSVGTGCWLMLTAHHPNATAPAFIYTSPRLRTDAMTETTEMCTQFVQTTSNLVTARRKNGAELAEQLRQAQEDLETEARKVGITAFKLAQQHTQNEIMQAMLKKLGANVPALGSESSGDNSDSD